MKIVRRRRYPRPKSPSKEEKSAAWNLFESGSEQEIRDYIERETAKVRAKWDRLDELRRRGDKCGRGTAGGIVDVHDSIGETKRSEHGVLTMDTLFDCLMYSLFATVLAASVGIVADFGWHVWVDDDRK